MGSYDLQCLLSEASSQLETGELLKAEGFDLFTVMSAVEIGEPRLDAGAEQNRAADLSQEALFSTQLDAAQVLGVMDQLTVMEATWHTGIPLAQTVYTCVYLLKQERISKLHVLSAFCTAMKVGVKIVSNMVYDTRVCEEEDIVPFMFGFQHSQGLPDVPKTVADITLAEEMLCALQRRKKSVSDDSLSETDQELSAALLARLRFRKHLLLAFQKLAGQSKQHLEAARKQLVMAAAELERMTKTANLAASKVEGFDPNANRHLMGPSPPRMAKLLTKEATLAYFSRLLQHLTFVCEIARSMHWAELKLGLETFAAFRPVPVARMAMALNFPVAPGNDCQPWVPQPAMIKSMLDLPGPGDLERLDIFIEQSALLAVSLARCKCLNRARQRRRHRRSITDWAQLLQHALDAENSAGFQEWLAGSDWRWQPLPGSRLEGQGPLSAWVELECCQELLQHLLLGFELECYLPYEFCMMYWYCDYLYGLAVEDANALAAALPPLKSSAKVANNRSKRLHKGKAGHDRQLSDEAIFFLTDAKVGGIERHLCQGLMRCAAALEVGGILIPRPAPFNSDEQYFEQRFFVLSQLSAPAPLTYEDYTSAMNLSDCKADELLRSAAVSFHEVQRNADLLLRSLAGLCPPAVEANVRVLERIAKQNLVAVALLPSFIKQESGEWAISWDFSYHNFFPVLCLKSVNKSGQSR